MFVGVHYQPLVVDFEGTGLLHPTETQRLSCTLPRVADLLAHAYLVVDLPDIYSGHYAAEPEEHRREGIPDARLEP